ncbi:MAG TPA: AI-2E family transporter [Candidatus Nanoarchaeia archaeon]|nr:AI-2E family transporter [Candidatus Nanoarchaeia archaeon]
MIEKEENKKAARKYLFWASIIILTLLSYLILKPYLTALISAFILAYLSLPLYKSLARKMPQSLAAIICMIAAGLIIIIPIAILIGGVIQQAYASITPHTITYIKESLSHYIPLEKIPLEALIEKITLAVIGIISYAFNFVPSFLIGLLITGFGMYYMLINWDYFTEKIKEYLPVSDKTKVTKEIAKATNGIIYGSVLIGIIEFFIAGIGFWLAGSKYYLLLPTLIFFSAFIPGIGPALIWLPAAIIYFLLGETTTAIGIAITGLIVSVLIDTILRNKIMSDNARIQPLIMLLGVFGGVSLFGIFGFIIGPLILAYTVELIQQLLKER